MTSTTWRIGRHDYKVVPPRWRDPRLHVAAIITTVQVFGQTSFGFELSITQILLSLFTCAVIDVVVVARRERVLAWPASALLTGNGIALLLRVNGTAHGDWWSFNGWWIFVLTGVVAIASKYLLRWPTGPVFNPSNIGLVVCFAVLGTNRVNPQDFWWGPPSPALVFVQALIVVGGVTLALRLRFLGASFGFWASFVSAVAIVALAGHAMTARWHVGTVSGSTYWLVLATSPEVLIFAFFMITDPQTLPRAPRARLTFGVTVGLLSALFASMAASEFATKVSLLGALAVTCAVRPLLERPVAVRAGRVVLGGLVFVAVLAGLAAVNGANAPRPVAFPTDAVPVVDESSLPPITIDPSVTNAGGGVNRDEAHRLVTIVLDQLHAESGRTYTVERATVVLVRDPAKPQSPPKIGVRVIGTVHEGGADSPLDRTVVPSP
jgi:Na+-translocating ferredoxin:NAD+ oxidoreductase RnfD subunit